jgi:mannose-1-phosphate guanylyltransferase
LQETIDRALHLAPDHRIVVVVSSERYALAKSQLTEHPEVALLAQPTSRDTAPAILLGLAHVRRESPRANVVVLPADHHIPRPQPIFDALRALASDESTCARVTMIGVVPDTHELEYGFVVPGPALTEQGRTVVRGVAAFHEKPVPAVARRLEEAGALFNTFITAGRVDAFFAVAEAVLPELVERFASYAPSIGTPDEDRARDALYEALKPASFSKDVLEQATELGVVSVEDTGWTDWGSPRRVFESLAATGELPNLVSRMSHVPIDATEPLRDFA